MSAPVCCTRCCSSPRPTANQPSDRQARNYDFCVTRVGFLGPHGTFAEEAVLTQPDLADQELTPLRSVPDVISAIERSEADIGLVPIENSIEGTVTVTLDTLAFDTDLLIQREIDLPVSLNLCALPGTKLDDIKTVLSHPSPFGQCRVWLASELPQAARGRRHRDELARGSGRPGGASRGPEQGVDRHRVRRPAQRARPHCHRD